MRSILLLRLAVLALCTAMWSCFAFAQANLEVNTPAIEKLRASLQNYFGEIKPYLANGAIGLTQDGLLAIRDANGIPLAQRQHINTVIAADNDDRIALYREIARANGKPEWEHDIRATFAQRWIDRAPAGWYYQTPAGGWVRK
jgi:uncharacterized protein YdbL (DUF1318 family)